MLITYFTGTAEDALLRPTHFDSIMQAETNVRRRQRHWSYQNQLYIYGNGELVAVLNRHEIWNRFVFKASGATYPWDNILERCARFAIRRVLRERK